jgi:hypothetical protein
MDFHPNMLASQRENPSPSRVANGPGFHPNMLANQWQPNQMAGADMLPGMGIATPPAPAPFVSWDAEAGTINIGGNQIKPLPAILTALVVKMVFFGGNVAAKGAKAAYSRFRGTSAATNPGRGRGFRPYRAMVYGKGCKIVCASRWGTKAAAQAWCDANEHRGSGSRINYVG